MTSMVSSCFNRGTACFSVPMASAIFLYLPSSMLENFDNLMCVSFSLSLFRKLDLNKPLPIKSGLSFNIASI